MRLPNASLDGSVSVSGFMERRLRENFPEVTAVVSKTGRAEISEDPMGPEQTDLLIMLKPRKEWTTAKTKPELVAAMQRELGKIPGIRLSFSQPIALRVNELISGVKSDLAVKIYGDDIALLKELRRPGGRGPRRHPRRQRRPRRAGLRHGADRDRRWTARRWRATASTSPT